MVINKTTVQKKRGTVCLKSCQFELKVASGSTFPAHAHFHSFTATCACFFEGSALRESCRKDSPPLRDWGEDSRAADTQPGNRGRERRGGVSGAGWDRLIALTLNFRGPSPASQGVNSRPVTDTGKGGPVQQPAAAPSCGEMQGRDCGAGHRLTGPRSSDRYRAGRGGTHAPSLKPSPQDCDTSTAQHRN